MVGGGTGADRLARRGHGVRLRVFYTGFILASDRVAATTSPLAFAASVATGAALSFTVAALLERRHPARPARA